MTDLLKALRRIPSFFKPLQRREPIVRFLDLPDDIIYEISVQLQVRSLCNLSLTCRRLYFTLLFPHLRRLGFEEPFTELHLHGENSSDALPALRLLFFTNPVKTLSWRAGKDPRHLVREAEQLRRLVARVPAVEYLELDFSNNWPVTESRYGHENSYWAWIRVCTNLLHVIAQKCHLVVLTNHYQVLAPWLTFIGGRPHNLDDALLSRVTKQWRAEMTKVRLKSPSKLSLHSPHTTRLPVFSPPFPPTQPTPGYTTARLIINDPGLFQRSLFGEWALKWVNMMPLTHLVVHQGRMRLPLLRQLRLSALVHLTISRGYGLTGTDIVQILQHNDSLSSLECLDTRLESSTGIIMIKKRKNQSDASGIGSSLQRIKGSITLLNRMLDLELALVHLTTLIVQVRSDATQEQAALQRLYKAISLRKSITTLVFELLPHQDGNKSQAFRLQSWLSVALGSEHGQATVAAVGVLRHVKDIRFHCNGSSSTSILFPASNDSAEPTIPTDLPGSLGKWLAMFPALREVSFVRIFDPQDRSILRGVVDDICRFSPKITTSIDGEKWYSSRYPSEKSRRQ